MERQDELMHYGRKGMKWGEHIFRKDYPVSETRRRVDSTKQEYKTAKKNYKTAKKQFNKSYNEAYSYSSRYPVTQYTKKRRRDESNELWRQADRDRAEKINSKQAYKDAQSQYKSAKAYRKAEINSTARQLTTDELVKPNTSQYVAKYMVDNNMSIEEAQKRYRTERNRNTVIGVMAAVGAYIVI